MRVLAVGESVPESAPPTFFFPRGDLDDLVLTVILFRLILQKVVKVLFPVHER